MKNISKQAATKNILLQEKEVLRFKTGLVQVQLSSMGSITILAQNPPKKSKSRECLKVAVFTVLVVSCFGNWYSTKQKGETSAI